MVPKSYKHAFESLSVRRAVSSHRSHTKVNYIIRSKVSTLFSKKEIPRETFMSKAPNNAFETCLKH